MSIDLTAVFERGVRALHEKNQRGDDELPHASHLGKCLYQTFLSRSGAEKMRKTVQSVQMLEKGLHDEQYIIDCLEAGLEDGWQLLRNHVINDKDLVGHVDIILARAKCPKCGQWLVSVDDPVWVCDHGRKAGYDPYGANDRLVIERRLVEVKTTTWKERWEDLGEIGKRGKTIKTRVAPGPYPEPSVTHRLQAIGYARRLPANPDGKHMPYAIFQWDRALNGFHQYPTPGEWYDSDDQVWLEKHDAWTKDVLRLTDPKSDPLETGIAFEMDGALAGRPPEPWMCGYCDYMQCVLNVNKANPLHAVQLEESVF